MRIEIRYALIMGFIAFLWTLAEYIIGLHTVYIDLHPYLTNIILPVPIYFTYKTIHEKKKEQGGIISYKTAFFSGFMMALIGAPLALIGHIIYVKLINPMFYLDMIAHGMSNIANHADKLSAEKELSDYFSLFSYSVQIVVGVILGGGFLSAIIALFMRTKNLLTVS
ncbi:MAG: DUF4199 domain-containing protein [Candidatus Kapabacteria bacterium]|jgi:hypothetical protein|nr:DUF4199 domain-containing protein [Candidatus Kapabacteria bacterium]